MIKLHDIVSNINTSLQVQFAAKRFQKGSFDGIAELVNENEETVPCTVSNNGDTTKLVIDDTKPFQVYHRLIRPSFENNEDDYSSRVSVRSTANMLMVVIGDRNRLQLTLEDILSGVIAGWPLVLTKTVLNTLELQSCDIVPGSFNTDKESVYKGEYKQESNMLKPNTIMFSFSYQIITVINQSCYTLCE